MVRSWAISGDEGNGEEGGEILTCINDGDGVMDQVMMKGMLMITLVMVVLMGQLGISGRKRGSNGHCVSLERTNMF